MAEHASSGGILDGPTSLWNGWLGWLPGFLRAVFLIIASYILLRILLRYVIPVGARAARSLAIGAARGLAWLAVRPESLATRVALRLHRTAPSAFAYGEAVAGLLEASERGIGRATGALGMSRKLARKLAFWSVAGVVVAANALAYHSHVQLPAVRWWHSVTGWFHSVGSHPVHHHVVHKRHARHKSR